MEFPSFNIQFLTISKDESNNKIPTIPGNEH